MLKFEGGEHQEISSIPFHFSARDLRKELKSLIFLHIILTWTFFLKNNQLTIKFCYTSVLQKYSIFTGLLTKVFMLGNTAFNKMCFYNIFLVAIWRQQKINLNFLCTSVMWKAFFVITCPLLGSLNKTNLAVWHCLMSLPSPW